VGLVTDVEPFLRVLVDELAALETTSPVAAGQPQEMFPS
jgi:hypothetical protein